MFVDFMDFPANLTDSFFVKGLKNFIFMSVSQVKIVINMITVRYSMDVKSS